MNILTYFKEKTVWFEAVLTLLLPFYWLVGSSNGQTVVYDDALGSGWLNYSWASVVDFDNTSPTAAGTNSISVDPTGSYGALYLFNETAVDVSNNDEIRLQLRGSFDGQKVLLFAVDGDGAFNNAGEVTLIDTDWTEVVLHISELGSPSTVSGVVVQETSGNANGSPVFFVDEIEIGDFAPESANEPLPGPVILVDVNDTRGPISDGVYGLNFADDTFAAEIGLPINRWGGNSTTRYNYLIDTTNLASDFYYENMFRGIGQSSDEFINKNLATGTESMITIGMLGYVAKSAELIGSYSVEKYGAQTDVNMYRPDHGNGILLDGTQVNNDPLDTGLPVDESFAAGWVANMVSNFGDSNNGGVRYYLLDNEPMLWHETHNDAHRAPGSYDEVFEKGMRYAEAIKAVDPNAEVMGPAVFGWTAYFYSALDAAPGGAWWENPQDRNAHGAQAFVPWYLEQMANYEANSGTRLLDYLDVHYYPQDSQIALEPAGDADRQQRRLDSTRTLWDPNFIDPSWINENVRLIPRLKEWIANHYPGTKLAINEYNFGAIEHINGALTQADVLGIFGREGVDIACFWASPASDLPIAYAFRMYRNYDGNANAGSRFGETSLATNSADPNQVSAFAARRTSDSKNTIVLVNKTADPRDTPLTFANLGNAVAEVYGYDDRKLDRIVRYGDLPVFDGGASITLPPNSITTLELEAVTSIPNQPSVADIELSNGSPQRSRVHHLKIQFDSLVSFVEDDPTFPVTLSHVDNGIVNLVVDDVNESEGFTTVTFTFEGPLTRAGNSLVDGEYQLSLNGLGYFDSSSRLAGTDFEAGGATESLYSLYGDSDGNRTVDIRDLLRFRISYRLRESDAGYADEFDFNDDGVINSSDLLAFRRNYRKTSGSFSKGLEGSGDKGSKR